jgi:hypothetical protein
VSVCAVCGSSAVALTACEHEFCAACLNKLGPILADVWIDALEDAPGGDEYATAFYIHGEQLWPKNPFGKGTS